MPSESCKICNCPWVHEVEDRILSGDSYQATADWLLEEKSLEVSTASIWRHMKHHVDVNDEPRQKVALALQREERKLREVNSHFEVPNPLIEEKLDDLGKIDELIEIDYSLYIKASALLSEFVKRKIFPAPLTSLLKTLNNNISRNLRRKLEYLGTDAESKKANAMQSWVDLMETTNDEQE